MLNDCILCNNYYPITNNFIIILKYIFFNKKTIYLSDNEKEYIKFVIDIFNEYGDDLGIQTKEQHKLLVDKLKKIINKHLI